MPLNEAGCNRTELRFYLILGRWLSGIAYGERLARKQGPNQHPDGLGY
jgi:hypothetical protein